MAVSAAAAATMVPSTVMVRVVMMVMMRPWMRMIQVRMMIPDSIDHRTSRIFTLVIASVRFGVQNRIQLKKNC